VIFLSESGYPGFKDFQDFLSESGYPGFKDFQDDERYKLYY
jgi:hypothetical protein